MLELFRSLFAPPRHLIWLVAALWLGLYLMERRVERHAVSNDALNNLVYYSLLGYLLGGRLFFVMENLSAFSQSPLSIFSIDLDLFDSLAAALTAILVGIVYGQRRRLPLGASLDALTPLFAMLAVGLSLSHLAAGTAFGKPTRLPWGIELWNATRHPSQIYELLAALVVFIWIWFRRPMPAGDEFILFVALTAGARLFLEAFRGDSTLIFGGIRLAQLIAWTVLAASLVLHEMIRRNEKPNETKSAPSAEEADPV